MELELLEQVLDIPPVPMPELPEAPNVESHIKPSKEPLKLDELPTELLDKIFMSLDGISLARVSATCRRFKAVVNFSSQAKESVWRKMCSKDFEKEAWLDVGSNMWKGLWRSSQLKNPNISWKDIYRGVAQWKFMREWTYEIHVTGNWEEDEFTCLEVAGSYIISGSTGGNVLMWDCDGLIGAVILHESKITSIAITVTERKDDEEPRLNTEGNDDYMYLILSLSADKVLQFTNVCDWMDFPTNMEVKRVPFDYISSSREDIVGWREFNTGDICAILLLKDDIQSIRICPFDPFSHQRRILTVGTFGTKVNIVTQGAGPCTYHEDNPTWVSDIMPEIDFSFRQAYAWPGDVTFSITSTFSVVVSVGRQTSIIHSWSRYRPTCAVLHGNLLAIGSDIGRVFLYFIENRHDLLNIEPARFMKALSICAYPIMFVRILDAQKYSDHPQLIAATRHVIYCVTFKHSMHMNK